MKHPVSLPVGQRLGVFEILGLLGKGGMGVVYRARDSRLHREVAIKVLPDNVVHDVEQLGRFEREARLLAALDHPNIATLYDFQQVEDSCFLVMQLVEGETLDTRLKRGALSFREALETFVPIALGLTAAHERGIVHRDLKPGNIKIDPTGRVRILDFGLAKSVEAPSAGEGSKEPTLPIGSTGDFETYTGAILGTPAYMSPEQAHGEPSGKLADIWAFGACLYEGLSGRRPFQGKSPADVLASILREEPNWTLLPSGLPSHIRSMVRRCLEKRPDRRLSSMSDIATTLEHALANLRVESNPGAVWSSEPEASRPGESVESGTAPRGSSRQASGTDSDSGSDRIRKLAVLPFKSIAKDHDEDWLVDGMTELLVTELGKIQSLIVISSTSTMQYKESDKSATEIADELKVGALVEGSVIRMGSDVRITARLIDGHTEERLWGDFFSGKFAEILKMQADVTLAIARKVRASVSPEEAARVENVPAVTSAAYEKYLRARTYYRKQSPRGLERAVSLYEHAIELDPEFAPAHAGLAVCLAGMMNFYLKPASELVPRMLAAAEKAMALAPDRSDSYEAMGLALRHSSRDWTRIETMFRRAIELDPNSTSAHIELAWYLAACGGFEEAYEQMEKARVLAPFSGLVWWSYAVVCLFGRDYEAMERHCRRGLELFPRYVFLLNFLGIARMQQGDVEGALPLIKMSVAVAEPHPPPHLLSSLVIVLHRTDDVEAARKVVARMVAQQEAGTGSLSLTSAAYAELGEADLAIEWLERGCEAREWSSTWIKTFPPWDPLRGDPRFQAIIEQLNLPDPSQDVGRG